MAAFIASRARSIAEAHGPTIHCAIGEPAVEGCGWVGAVFSAARSTAPIPTSVDWHSRAHRREFFLLLTLGVIQDHLLEFGEHAVELRAGYVHRLQNAEHPGGLLFLLVPGIGDRRPGVPAADRPQHHFLSCLVHGQQDTQLIEGLLLASFPRRASRA